MRTTDALKNFVKTTKVSKETQNYSVCDHEDNELKAGKEYIFEIRVIVPCGFGATAMLRARLGEGEGEYCFLLVWFLHQFLALIFIRI